MYIYIYIQYTYGKRTHVPNHQLVRISLPTIREAQRPDHWSYAIFLFLRLWMVKLPISRKKCRVDRKKEHHCWNRFG